MLSMRCCRKSQELPGLVTAVEVKQLEPKVTVVEGEAQTPLLTRLDTPLVK